MNDPLFGIDRKSVAFAKKHAAETIGKTRLADGTLINDPDSEWRIDDAARKKIRDALVSMCEGEIYYRRVAGIIAQATGFPQKKAELLCHHETMTINAASSLESPYEAQRAGVTVKKAWSAATDSCPACQANAAAAAFLLKLSTKNNLPRQVWLNAFR